MYPSDHFLNTIAPFHHCQFYDLDQFNAEEIGLVLHTAASMKDVLSRDMPQVPTLRGKTICNGFFDARPLSQLAFDIAARSLSAEIVNLDTSKAGGSHGSLQDFPPTDLAHMIHGMGADMLVLSHPQAGMPYQMGQHFEGALINAGDGDHAEPTEALTDLLTIRERFEHIEHLKVVLVGDVLHSPVARSLLWGLSRLQARVTLCAPPPLLGLAQNWQATWPDVVVTPHLPEAMEEADVVKVLPFQPERYHPGLEPSLSQYHQFFVEYEKPLQRAREHVLLIPSASIPMGTEGGVLSDHTATLVATLKACSANRVAIYMALLYLLLL